MRIIFVSLIFGLALTVSAAPRKLSPIISVGKEGILIYTPDSRGNRIPDFSSCGYAAGERHIPDASVRVVVVPAAGDETERIQKAIDYVAGLPMDNNGLRGAVLLLKGRHEVFGGLQITNSGVVLRGQGMDESGTVLIASGTDRRTLIRIIGQNNIIAQTNSGWQIAEDYVPVGATSFHLAKTDSLSVGDTVDIVRPATKEWINSLGMTEFGGGIGDWRLVWHPGNYDLVWDRAVQKIENGVVTVDSPITTAMDKNFGGGYVRLYSWPGRLTNVGVENLRLESAYDSAQPKDENHSWFAITMENAADAWVRQVTFEHFAGSAAAIYENCKRTTVEDCLSLSPVSEDAGWRRNTFFTMGQQTLFLRCWAENGRHDFSVGFCAAGPNAFVQCEDALPSADSGTIGAWSCGTLFDNVRIDGNGLSLKDRAEDGEGSGWSGANSVLWQCDASKISCQNPPGAQNWAFGCWGEFEGNGIWRQANSSVRPVSLYVAQVAQRLGQSAAEQISLMPRSFTEFSNPTAGQAVQLIRASTTPAPQLSDFIAHASERDPIPCDPGDAPQIENIPDSPPAQPVILHKISITNGWLVCDGKLLIGNVEQINWWRGNMRPSEAKDYGVNLTRFAPGRLGPGFTDDLNDLAENMVWQNDVALDYHYGLWYDRRREDHERVRRETGDVWAPFYEQPFARSGKGTAWDGLSKYDLTKFNPWYWARLSEFSSICDERGLVLFNENYFQHNILEAGAHWVDCPWRSANNINDTAFPEPPPFAGDKRIFMAEQFYDANSPVRRKLHEGFIRQNLDNFRDKPNVIQFTSAEFTGPLEFEQFWLDTIGDWERETGRKEIIALCCTKDVQDAILADPRRSQVVDVICFRYWWQTHKGLFAPKGGQNLSPRQVERLWKGGTPTDEDLAAMAAEYRAHFPGKVVIASGEDERLCGGWAFTCAGGSMPVLPKTTDGRLLAAIPQMQPWTNASKDGRRILREPGKQFLIYSDGSATAQLDLSSESGTFQIHTVDSETGTINSGDQTVQAGGKVTLPEGIIWLTRE